MGIGLGVGINRSNYAQGIFGAYQSRVIADGGVTEAGTCVDAVSGLLLTASLLLIPSGYKSGKAYAEIPTNGNGDLTWTRASTALRTNSSGLLESMGSGVPRLSYMYGSCPALLLEPQRTNTMLYSQDFSNAAWTVEQSTATANNATAPDGTTTATKLTEDLNLGIHGFRNNAGINLTNGTYTYTIYAKDNGRRYVNLSFNSGTGSYTSGIIVDLQSVSVTQTFGSGFTSTSVTSVGNGWNRISFTAALNSTTYIYVALSNASTGLTTTGRISYTGNGTSSIYLWGAQLELGAYATTIIPTTTASATRIADSFSRNNIYTNGLITSSGGTWFVELRNNIGYTRDAAAFGLFIDSASGGITNGFSIRQRGTAGDRLSIQKQVAGTQTFLYLTTTNTTKLAIKWNGTTADIFANGTKVVTATSFTPTAMEFLNASIADVPFFIQAMALYPSPLSDTDCTTLTTL
jgi:hypothetical protein